MKIPALTGLIKRRFLINFRVDADVLGRFLPEPFQPKLVNGYGIGGICLIKLEKIRPKLSPISCGLSSENAAHRFAVTWPDGEGVYIPRRDTDSLLNHLTGGRMFPGVHHLAQFKVREDEGNFEFSMQARDRSTNVSFKGNRADKLPDHSCFSNLQEASDFFENGSIGYSDAHEQGYFDGLKLATESWSISPLNITEVSTSFLNDEDFFPAGSVTFDHALLMENIEHEWHALEPVCCAS